MLLSSAETQIHLLIFLCEIIALKRIFRLVGFRAKIRKLMSFESYFLPFCPPTPHDTSPKDLGWYQVLFCSPKLNSVSEQDIITVTSVLSSLFYERNTIRISLFS